MFTTSIEFNGVAGYLLMQIVSQNFVLPAIGVHHLNLPDKQTDQQICHKPTHTH